MKNKRKVKFNGAKILMLTTTDNMVWQFLTPHVQDLIGYGARVDCACAKTGFWFDDLRDKFGLNMIELPIARKLADKGNFKAYKMLKNLQKQNGYDLIYCHQAIGSMLARMLGKKFNIPVIYMAHGFAFCKGGNKLKNLVYRTAEKHFAKSTDILITMNQEDYDACAKWKCGHRYKTSGIGLNREQLDNAESVRAEVRKELGIKDEVIVLTVAEHIGRKNYETMLKTIAGLKDKKIKFVSCGTGRDLDKHKQLAHALGIDDKVEFLGFRKDIDRLMTSADIFYLPSRQEGLTISIIEAMSYGLPVVTSKVRGNADLIDDGTGGFVCAPNDDVAQANALNVMLNHKELRDEFGEYNKQKSQKYSLQHVRDELRQIYKENGFID